MKPAPFVHHVPKTLDEALKTLAEVAPKDGRVLAGGQSLVPIMAFRLAKPAHLVDINGVAGLDKLASDGKTLSIGACVRHAAFHKPVIADPLGQLLTVVARDIAHYPIRMRGLSAEVSRTPIPRRNGAWSQRPRCHARCRSVRGSRAIAASDFFAGIMSTTLAEDELLAEVRLPLLSNDTKFGFNEFSRRAGDFAMAASLATYRLQDGKIRDARVGVGGARVLSAALSGGGSCPERQRPTDAAFRAAADAAAKAIDPLEDHQTDAEYRRDLVRAVVRRALEQSVS